MSQKAGKKTNKQTVAAQKARREREEKERQQAKNGKKKRDAKEIAVIVISIIVACSLMLPSLAQIFAQPQTTTIPTTPEEFNERYLPLVEQYEADLNADPEDADAELNLANTYYEWGTYARMFGGTEELTTQSQDAFEKAYDAFGRFIEMQGGLESEDTKAAATSQALCNYYMGNDVGAVEQLTKLAEDENYPNAWANLGMIYQGLGNEEEAIAAYQKGIESDPDDANGTKSYCEQQLQSIEESHAEDDEANDSSDGDDAAQDDTATGDGNADGTEGATSAS